MTREELQKAFGHKVKVNSHNVQGVYTLIEYHLKWRYGKLTKSVTVTDGIRTEYTVPIDDVEVIE